MDRRSWAQACERSKLATEHLAAFEKVDPSFYESVDRPWEAFLSEFARAFNKLFHGERCGSPSFAVTQRIRTDRKQDPLLSYLREARDSLEHGIGLMISEMGDARPLRPDEGYPIASFVVRSEDGTEQEMKFTRETTLVMENVRPVLASLQLTGREVAPPVEHLGADITGITPADAARLGLRYLDDRLAELEPHLEG